MKNLNKIIILIGFVVATVGLLLSVIFYEDVLRIFLLSNTSACGLSGYIIAIIAILAVCFTFAQNKTLVNFGTALSVLSGIMGFCVGMYIRYRVIHDYIYNGKIIGLVAIGLIIMLCGAIVKLIMDLVNYFKQKRI